MFVQIHSCLRVHRFVGGSDKPPVTDLWDKGEVYLCDGECIAEQWEPAVPLDLPVSVQDRELVDSHVPAKARQFLPAAMQGLLSGIFWRLRAQGLLRVREATSAKDIQPPDNSPLVLLPCQQDRQHGHGLHAQCHSLQDIVSPRFQQPPSHLQLPLRSHRDRWRELLWSLAGLRNNLRGGPQDSRHDHSQVLRVRRLL